MRDEYRSNIAFLCRELTVCQQRVAHAQSKIKMDIRTACKLLSESFELLRRVDALFAQTRAPLDMEKARCSLTPDPPKPE
jgi:hypothetical protein